MKIGNWLKRRYNKRMEDDKKIQAIIDELNKHEAGKPWQAAEGFHSLTVVKFIDGKDDQVQFNPSSGVPLKAFVNTSTGEIKTYWFGKVIK